MDDLRKKGRDMSRSATERGTALALRAIGPAIANCNMRLARCRAVASLAKPGYATAIAEESHALRGTIVELRKQLAQIVSTLPVEQHGSSRIRDTRLSLDRLETGIEGTLELVAAHAVATGDGAETAVLFAEGGSVGGGQSRTAS